MALADGISEIKTCQLTLHTKTAIYIATLFTEAKFDVSAEENGCHIIRCQGIGFSGIPN